MNDSDDPVRGEQALEDSTRGSSDETASADAYFLPEEPMPVHLVRRALRDGSTDDQARLVSQLLCYGLWDDIWSLVDQEQVKELFPHLDLPPKLEKAWARWLDLDLD